MAMDFFIPTIATIRSYVATALVVLCIYRENEQERFGPINIILYIIAALMHSIGAALILFRVMAYICFNDAIRNRTRKIVLSMMVLGAAVVLYPYYAGVMNDSLTKALFYLDSGSYTYVWERLICIIQTIYIIIIVYRSKKNRVFDYALGKMEHMLIAASALLVISNIQFSFLVRFTFFVELLVFPLTMVLLSIEKQKGSRKTYSLTVFTILITLLLTCSRGYLCSLKFWT